MKKNNQKNLYISLIMISLFLLWTLLIRCVDVRAIGPMASTVGFATINQFVHEFTGVNMTLYIITDWLGLVPIFLALGFALLGLFQMIKRKRLKTVDYNIYVLGGFYIVIIAIYFLFQMIVVNYRPILINSYLEPSYPSSTTLLVMTVMPTAIMQFKARINNNLLRKLVNFIITIFIIFMVIGRLISGVHWFSDIVGGAILSTGLVMMYRYVVDLNNK